MNFKKFAMALSLCAAAVTPAAFATTISLDHWVPSSGVIPAADDPEWISLTRADQIYTGANLQSKRVFSKNETIKVEFDYISWGGVNVGADGLAISLFDASAPNAGANGFHSSALGYCRMEGAYMGIGLDEYGNFSSSCENAVWDGLTVRNSVTIRGGQASNWGHVKNFPVQESLDCEGARCKTRQEAIAAKSVKHVVALLTPKSSGGYAVELSINGTKVIDKFDYAISAPDLLKVSISASNGGFSNHHEIRRLQANADGPNLAEGIPAYIAGSTVVNYPILNDGDRVHKGWNGVGKWTGVAGVIDYGAVAYGLDYSGADCLDVFGACATPPSKGLATANTITVYARQDDGTETEPTDSTTFTQHGPVDMRLDIYNMATGDWDTVQRISNNNLVKRTFTFPTRSLKHVLVAVEKAAGTTGPSIVEMEAFNK